jgi:hypothetical protein
VIEGAGPENGQLRVIPPILQTALSGLQTRFSLGAPQFCGVFPCGFCGRSDATNHAKRAGKGATPMSMLSPDARGIASPVAERGLTHAACELGTTWREFTQAAIVAVSMRWWADS